MCALRWIPGAFALLLSVGLEAGSGKAGPPFMEIEGTVDQVPGESGEVFLRITKIIPVGGAMQKKTERLFVDCPLDLNPWRTRFEKGDSVQLEWKVERDPSHGWLLWGGRPGRAILGVPAQGIKRICTCEGKSRTRQAILHAEFVLTGGKCSPEIECRGRSEHPLMRILPFWSGGRARPPKIVRLRIAWDAGNRGPSGG